MPPAKPQPVKPLYIALACVVAVTAMFAGSIIISVAVVKAENAAPQQGASDTADSTQ
ncbi:MAG: hypothetical protein ACLQUZ_05840 [Rhizomicrobium sp.]